MSLYMYFEDEPLPAGVKLLENIEAEFTEPVAPISEPLLRILAAVEQAKPSKNPTRFVDRFGGELYWDSLSTGTKAAFVVDKTDVCVNLRECGRNAVRAIVANLTHGSILIYYPDYNFPSGPIDVILHGKHFTDGEYLTDYIREECL